MSRAEGAKAGSDLAAAQVVGTPDGDGLTGGLERLDPRLLPLAQSALRGLELNPEDGLPDQDQVGESAVVPAAVVVVPPQDAHEVAQVGDGPLEVLLLHQSICRWKNFGSTQRQSLHMTSTCLPCLRDGEATDVPQRAH